MRTRIFTLLLFSFASLVALDRAEAQVLQELRVVYDGQTPQVAMRGISPVYYIPETAEVTVTGHDITIALEPPEAGFSVVVGWDLTVPLPQLDPNSINYDVRVVLSYPGSGSGLGVVEQIGFLRAWIHDQRAMFASGFE